VNPASDRSSRLLSLFLIFPASLAAHSRQAAAQTRDEAPFAGRAIQLSSYLQSIPGERVGHAEPSAFLDGAQPPSFALVGGWVVDGTGRDAIADAVVIVQDGRLDCVGSHSRCPVPAGMVEIDATGKWIIPGLVDAHVHYSQTGWADGRPDAYDARALYPYDRTIAELRENPQRFFRSYLCSGVTATFDVGGFPWTWGLRPVAEGSPFAPHVAAAGPLLSTRDHWLNLPGERQFLYMSDEEAVERDARYLAGSGTDALKVWYLVGATSPDTARFKELLRVGARVASERELPLIVHATGLWQAKDALKAGAQLLVHSVYDREVDHEFLQLARRGRIIYTPTLTVFRGYVELRSRGFDEDRYAMECVDPETRQKARLTRSLPLEQDVESLARAAEAAREQYRVMLANLRHVHEAGIVVAMGTDAGNPLTLHGPSVNAEMEAMQEAGLSPMEVLVAATRNGALAMRRLDDFGTLEKGKIADVVVLDADPLEDIQNVRRVALVIRGGAAYTRAELEHPENH
jgi:imidazolonepropionase-like amidohydrolase